MVEGAVEGTVVRFEEMQVVHLVVALVAVVHFEDSVMVDFGRLRAAALDSANSIALAFRCSAIF